MSWLTNKESIQSYNNDLLLAIKDDKNFASFRSLSGIRDIVEGIPDITGIDYFTKLVNNLSLDGLTKIWDRATKNDHVGSPRLVEFEINKLASSTTMRYLWNVLDMEERQIVLDDVDIIEVGGGYGGLCRMIHEFHTPKSYTIIDLPNALMLAKRYLKCFDIEIKTVSCDEFNKEPVDTFISNYALTELTKQIQDKYVQKIMCNAKYGYVTYNSQLRNEKKQHSLNDLRKSVSGYTDVYNENVKKSECKVLIWRPK